MFLARDASVSRVVKDRGAGSVGIDVRLKSIKQKKEKKEKRNRQGNRKELHLRSYTFAAQLTKVSIVRCKKTTSQLGRSKLRCDTIERCRGWYPSKSSKNAFSRRFSVARPLSRFRWFNFHAEYLRINVDTRQSECLINSDAEYGPAISRGNRRLIFPDSFSFPAVSLFSLILSVLVAAFLWQFVTIQSANIIIVH